MDKMIIGVDVGGTKVAGGLVDRKGRLDKAITLPTKANEGFEISFGQVVAVIKRLINQVGGPDHVKGIGMCCPGPLNPRTGMVINPPNLPGWVNIPFAERVEKEFQIPARLENDANAAGLAEVLFGAAVGYTDVFYVTVSTGVGTGIIINKKVYHGKNGFAAEGGHVTIDHRSPYICGCGTPGDIEALAAGPAIVRRTIVKLEQEHTVSSLLRERSQNQLNRITPEMIQESAAEGDSVAKSMIEETGFFLGIWLASMITLLDPDAIVIGGGVSQIGKPLFDKIRETIPHYTINRQATNTPILSAKLQKDVGIFGAASLFLQEGEKAEKD
ncbi:MAG: ROK family protein [Acidobacteria bacterium]|nr:MAG: ROK family protein [Acidobacteriota bacterium]